jgi:beta-mannosidase
VTAPFVDEQLATRRWPDLDWERLAEVHGCAVDVFERRLPPSEFATYDEWRDAAQRHQCHVLKVQIEALRRIKYRPTGGFCFSLLADGVPAISSAVIGADGRRKPAYDVVRAACATVLVTAEPLPRTVVPGDRVDVDIHVVNDLRSAIDFAVVDAVVTWPGGEHRFRFGGGVPADEVVGVGRAHVEIPDDVTVRDGDEVVVELRLTAGEISATNRTAAPLGAR